MSASALLLCLALGQAPPTVTLADDGTVLLGTPGKPASQLELFEALGRDDLAGQARARLVRRVALISSGAVVIAASVAVGVTLLATAAEPHLTSCPWGAYCPGPTTLTAPAFPTGPVILGAGLLAGGLLLYLGVQTSLEVLSPPELRRLASDARSSAPGPSLRVTPWLGPGGGGLSARLSF